MELLSTVVVSTRIRLARNLEGYPFPHRISVQDAKSVVYSVRDALSRVEDFTLHQMDEIPIEQAERFMENYLISPALLNHRKISAVLVNGEENLSIMLNEEDHIREQCFAKGYDLFGCYEILSAIDDALSKSVPLAYDEHFGYLTACPTNLGTGLRASVMLFLPGLTANGLIPSLMEKMGRLGLVLRGAYGEGSESLGALYQLSNDITLGTSEEKILTEVNNAVLRIAQFEGEERKSLYLSQAAYVRDRALRAYGILTNCALLSYEEAVALFADVKLGAALSILSAEHSLIDDLTVLVRNANLRERMGIPLTELELMACRATVTGPAIKKIVTRVEE